MVLTDEYQQDTYPVATLEDGATSVESNYYTINGGSIVTNPVSLPSSYNNNNGNPPYNVNPTSVVTATSNKMYKLGGAGNITGLNITIKVMSGDTVSIFAKSFWHSNGTTSNSNTITATDLLTALAGTGAIANAGKGATASALLSSSITPADVTNFLGGEPTVPGRPNAYVNWILFDEQFRVVSASSGFEAVDNTSDVLKTHTPSVNISKSGYLYVYCSNESNQDVFFDNLQLIHNHGPLLEETHYYPFGLTMAGISSKAAGKLENRFKYNGGSELQNKEFSDGSGLEMYDAQHRFYDPQIGRFGQIDRLSDLTMNMSPYLFSSNNPISRNDPTGLSDTIRTNTPSQTPGFGKTPNVLDEVTVTSSNKRYQSFTWFGSTSTVDTHLRGNINSFTQRANSGQNLLQQGDRYSYLQNLTEGKLLDACMREQDAQEFERLFYEIYFSAFTLPEDVLLVGGLIKGVSSIPKLYSILRAVKAGETVLGHYPEYFRLVEQVGARKFSIPEAIWNKMSEAERWGANQKLLDRMIARGDNVLLATPIGQARAGSYFAREVEYLFSKGYELSADSSRMIKP